MEKTINIWGIETNNLKNIDVQIERNALNLIIGPSGSGKSSLAYDTIAQIGQHEFMSMFADNISDPTYRIKGYENIKEYLSSKEYNSVANLMQKATPEVVSKTNVLFSFKNSFEVVLFEKNLLEIQKLLKQIFERKYSIVAVTSEE